MQVDSVDRQRYAYVRGDPQNYSDPTGMMQMHDRQEHWRPWTLSGYYDWGAIAPILYQETRARSNPIAKSEEGDVVVALVVEYASLEYTANFTANGSDEWIEALTSSLGELASLPSGRRLLAEIAQSGHSFRIVEASSRVPTRLRGTSTMTTTQSGQSEEMASMYGVGANPEIQFVPSRGGSVSTTAGEQELTPAVMLAHELGHGIGYATGTIAGGLMRSADGTPVPGYSRDEPYAMRVENAVRADLRALYPADRRYAERTVYLSNPQTP